MRALWQRLRLGMRVMLRRSDADAELDAEVQHYFDAHVATLHASGLAPAEARRRARLELGEPATVREDVRAAGWEHVLTTVLADVRYALRRMRNNPGATTVCAVTLALGIGASTAIFSAVKPILLEPLPYPHAERLVTIWDRAAEVERLDVTFGTYRELAERNRSFENVAVSRIWQPTLTGIDEPQRIDGQLVSAAYFRVLGIAPFIGRDFNATDDMQNGAAVAVLSHAMWQRHFNGDATVIGRAITLNDRQFTVIAVMPATFENVLVASTDLWAPLQYDISLPPNGREWGHHLTMIGRVRSGVSVADARADVNAIAQSPLPEFTRVAWADLNLGMTVESLHAEVTRGVRPALLAIVGAVLLVLAIASLNVTSLMLAQSARRRGELALRTVLGAGRTRLVVQHVIEALVLSCIGAVTGIAVAYAGIRSLLAVAPQALPRVAEIRFDSAVFLFALALTSVIGIGIGIASALHWTRRGRTAAAEQQSVRVASRDSRTRRALVIVEVALAVVLLVSGGLLMRSLQRLLAVDAGFDSTNVLTMQLRASVTRFDSDEAVRQYFAQLLDAVRAVPGVATAALTSQLPLTGDYDKYGLFLASADAQLDPDGDGSALRYAVTPGYFDALGIRLHSGRLLNEGDATGATRAALINQSTARRIFPGTDGLGERIRLGNEQEWSTVVGVVADVKHESLAAPDENAVYVAAAQTTMADRTLRLVVRTSTNARAIAPAVRNAIWSLQRDQPISDIATMTELVDRSAAERRFILIIFQAFALTALILAAVGLYGLLAGGVHERLREIGVRAALGATRTQIVSLVLRQALTLTGCGVVLGLLCALAVTRALVSMLFGTSPTDPLTYAAVALLLLTAATVAASLPAWRAMRVDPAVTLRAGA